MPEFTLPDVGEGLTEAEIVSWRVAVGDSVAVNDVVVEIETAKSLVELPAPFAGRVAALLVQAGDTVPVGTPILRIDEPSASAAADALTEPPAGDREAEADRSSVHGSGGGDADSGGSGGGTAVEDRDSGGSGGGTAVEDRAVPRQPVLVGYGPSAAPIRRRARRAVGATGSDSSPEAAAAIHATFSTADPLAQPVLSPRPVRVLAKPPVRRLAKDLGIDLAGVEPTGPAGTVTRADVLAAQAAVAAPSGDGSWVGGRGLSGTGWLGLAREERTPIRSVRKATAAAVTRSAFTAPHVSVWRSVDVTRTMRLIRRLRASAEFAGVRLSPLAVTALAMCLAARRTPEVNARWDDAASEIVTQRYVNLGVAVATGRGLIVPNVKDAHALGLRDLAMALANATAGARSGRATPADLSGATMTLTNIGVFDVDGGTPILPPGESVIVALGAVREQAWVHQGRVRPRRVTTVAASFDHRLVDGEQGARFVADICRLLERPDTALAWS